MNQLSEDTDKDAVTIVREMAAPPAAVYDAFINPDGLMLDGSPSVQSN